MKNSYPMNVCKYVRKLHKYTWYHERNFMENSYTMNLSVYVKFINICNNLNGNLWKIHNLCVYGKFINICNKLNGILWKIHTHLIYVCTSMENSKHIEMIMCSRRAHLNACLHPQWRILVLTNSCSADRFRQHFLI